MVRPRKVSDESLVDVLDRAQPPVLTAREVAERVDLSTTAVRQRLTSLAEAGEVIRKDAGGAVVFYSVDLLMFREYQNDLERNRERE